jgi:hypothetical protein
MINTTTMVGVTAFIVGFLTGWFVSILQYLDLKEEKKKK